MKANKITLEITIEVLDADSIHSLLRKVDEQLRDEVTSGEASYRDGDSVTWDMITVPIDF